MKSEIEKINPLEYGLDEQKAMEVESNFLPIISEADLLIPAYQEIIAMEITKDLIPKAGELRKKFMRLRTETDRIHKTTKAFYLAGGRFVDAWKNKNVSVIESMESKLLEIENYYINIEKERIANLEIERLNKIKQYTEVLPMGLGQMADDVYQNYLAGLKLAYESRIKAEKEAEEKRLAEIEAEKQRQIQIEAENKRLKAEAEAKQKELELERKKAEEKAKKEREDNERKLAEQKKIQDAILAKQKTEAEAERKRLESIALEEQKKKNELERQLREKEAKELADKQAAEKMERDRIAAEKKAAKAPDKEKLIAFINSIQLPLNPSLNSDEAKQQLSEIQTKFQGFKNWAQAEISKL